MSVSFAGKVEMAIRPYADLPDLLRDLRTIQRSYKAGRNHYLPTAALRGLHPSNGALPRTIRVLELLRDFLADEV